MWHPHTRAIVAMRGADAVDLLNRLCTQDVRALQALDASRPALLVSAQGKLLHPLIAYNAGDAVHLVTTAGEGAALAAHLTRYTIVEDVDYAVLGEHVPAATVLFTAAGPLREVATGSVRVVPAGPHGPALTLLPGPRGLAPASVALAGPGDDAAALQRALGSAWAATGAEALPAPVDDGAFRYLRVRAGVAAAGEDFEPGAMPLELRLGTEAVSWRKGCYVGQEVLSRLDSYRKVARLLVGFCAPAKAAAALAAAANGVRVLQDGRPVGRVTSFAVGRGSWPVHAAGDGPHVLGLAVVKTAAAQPGAAVTLQLVAEASDALSDGGATVEARLYDCAAWG